MDRRALPGEVGRDVVRDVVLERPAQAPDEGRELANGFPEGGGAMADGGMLGQVYTGAICRRAWP